jgi:hypothetical protein
LPNSRIYLTVADFVELLNVWVLCLSRKRWATPDVLQEFVVIGNYSIAGQVLLVRCAAAPTAVTQVFPNLPNFGLKHLAIAFGIPLSNMQCFLMNTGDIRQFSNNPL